MKKTLLLLLIFSFFNICFSQWVNVGPFGTKTQSGLNNGLSSYLHVLSLVKNDNNIFAGTDGAGIYLSSNNGTNWISRNSGIGNNSQIWSFVSSGTKIYAGTYYNGVYMTGNSGLNWTKIGLDSMWVLSLVISGPNLIAGTETGVYYTSNDGVNWISPGLDSIYFFTIAKSGQNLYAGTYNNGLIMSTNNGANWVKSSLNYPVSAIVGSENCIFAGACSGYIYRSTNNGLNWEVVSDVNNNSVLSMVSSGTNIFASSSNKIYVSTNNGNSWNLRNEGLTGTGYIYSLLISNGYVYAGTYESSAWRRPLSEFSGIRNISMEIPDKYSLSQNFPNPFNPNTSIKFNIKENGFVSLKVYNALGKEVAALVNEKLQAGTYEVPFSLNNISNGFYSSGVYFYRLHTDNFIQTKKMIILK